jgi:hypothetical protein
MGLRHQGKPLAAGMKTTNKESKPFSLKQESRRFSGGSVKNLQLSRLRSVRR